MSEKQGQGGPWVCGAFPDDGKAYVQIKRAPYTGEGECMALAAPDHARLIAAAPAMREALGELLTWAEMMGGWDAPAWGAARKAFKAATKPARKGKG